MRGIAYSRTQLYWRNIKLFMLFWTLVFIASLIWNLYSQRQSIEASLHTQAAAIHGMEMEYRNWVIQNGGVYVPVSDKIQPNPWLSHVPERDIKTPSGKQLTLLNSSYVVRLVHDNMRTSGSSLRGNIASMRPINPTNAADTWERQAIEAFGRGDKESASFDVLEDGKTYYRYMKPMVTEESCLKCHARFGDKLGDIRGGVSVAIPVDVVMLAGRSERNAMVAGHGLIWGLGLIGLFVGGRKQQQAIQAVEKSEETLRTNEERLHLATTAGNIGIWDWDVARNVLAWDESMYTLYGIRKEDFGGAYDAWIHTLHPDDRQFTDGEIQAALRGEREYAPEFRIIRPDGTVRNIKAASKTYYDPEGKPLRMIGTNIDITERKRSEEELRTYKDHLEEEVQLRTTDLVLARNAAESANQAKSVFLSSMSHELRTPLNAILGFSSMMSKDALLSQEQRENLDIINRSGEHLLTLINDVLEMAKIEAGRVQMESAPFDLGSLVRDVTDMMHIRAQEKGLQLLVDQSSEFPRYIKGDEARVRQVLINLVGNAVKFTPQGGIAVRFGLKPHALPPRLLIEVEDSGIGISVADQQKIFEPFVQLGQTAAQKGTGLGLTITRQFVQLMGGTISVESTQGKGSIFRVELPAERVEASDVTRPEGVRKGEIVGLLPGQPEYRILIVEDQLENQLLLAKLMKSVGFLVKVAENGQLALELFKSWRPHLIWMDRRMPVMDGVEATRRIRELPGGTDVKIVAVTASAFAEQRVEILDAGMDDFVRKPYRFNEIYECLTRQLGVQYTYADAPAAEEESDVVLTAKMLAVLPPELCLELRDALVSLDGERISAVIGQAASCDSKLHKTLLHLAENYDYPAILNVLQTSQPVSVK